MSLMMYSRVPRVINLAKPCIEINFVSNSFTIKKSPSYSQLIIIKAAPVFFIRMIFTMTAISYILSILFIRLVWLDSILYIMFTRPSYGIANLSPILTAIHPFKVTDH